MKIILLFGIVLANTALAQNKPLVVDMQGNTVETKIKVRNCRPGYVAVFEGGNAVTWKTGQTSNGVTGNDFYSTYYTSVAAKCAPKVCEVERPWKILGNPHSIVRILPGEKEIGRFQNEAETKKALTDFIANGVCAKILKYTIH